MWLNDMGKDMNVLKHFSQESKYYYSLNCPWGYHLVSQNLCILMFSCFVGHQGFSKIYIVFLKLNQPQVWIHVFTINYNIVFCLSVLEMFINTKLLHNELAGFVGTISLTASKNMKLLATLYITQIHPWNCFRKL